MLSQILSLMWSSIPLLFSISVCLYMGVVVVPFWRRIQVVRALPGPPISHWLYGHLREMRPVAKGFRFKRRWAAKHPKLCRYVFAPWIVQVQVSHPETIKQVILEMKSEKGELSLTSSSSFSPKSLLFYSGSAWKERRRLLTPVFHFDMLSIYIGPLNRTARKMLSAWEQRCSTSEYFNCSPDLSKLALEAFLQSAFSLRTPIEEVDGFSLEEYGAAQNLSTLAVDVRIRNPLYRLNFIYNLTSHRKRLAEAQKFVRDANLKFLNKRREEIRKEESLNKKDFCTILLTTPQSDGSYLTDEEIQAEVNTFIFAGHETTSHSIGWAIYNLGRYQELQEICRQEITSVLGDREEVSREDLSQLTFLSMFIKESLRMYPVVSSVSKVSQRQMTIDGHVIPKGSMLNIGIYQAHYLEEFWPEPDRFDPYRFSSENIDRIDPFSYLPFSAGARNCIGQKFAVQEIQIVLALILKKFRVSLDSAHSYEPAFRIVIQAEKGIKITLEQI